jgi:hypothetical protein
MNRDKIIELQHAESDRAKREAKTFVVGDTIRMPHYATAGGFRVWKVIGQYLGGTRQEGTYALQPLDVVDNQPIQVPCIILETHPGIERT